MFLWDPLEAPHALPCALAETLMVFRPEGPLLEAPGDDCSMLLGVSGAHLGRQRPLSDSERSLAALGRSWLLLGCPWPLFGLSGGRPWPKPRVVLASWCVWPKRRENNYSTSENGLFSWASSTVGGGSLRGLPGLLGGSRPRGSFKDLPICTTLLTHKCFISNAMGDFTKAMSGFMEEPQTTRGGGPR